MCTAALFIRMQKAQVSDMRKAFAKLRSRRGVTLTEVLLTVLITAMTASVAAVGVTSSLRVYNDSTALSDAQTLSSTIAQTIMDELRFADDIAWDADSVVFTSKTYGSNSEIVSEGGYIYINGKAILPDGAYAGYTAETDVKYDGAEFDVVITIYSSGKQISAADFSVCPIEN